MSVLKLPYAQTMVTREVPLADVTQFFSVDQSIYINTVYGSQAVWHNPTQESGGFIDSRLRIKNAAEEIENLKSRFAACGISLLACPDTVSDNIIQRFVAPTHIRYIQITGKNDKYPIHEIRLTLADGFRSLHWYEPDRKFVDEASTLFKATDIPCDPVWTFTYDQYNSNLGQEETHVKPIYVTKRRADRELYLDFDKNPITGSPQLPYLCIHTYPSFEERAQLQEDGDNGNELFARSDKLARELKQEFDNFVPA